MNNLPVSALDLVVLGIVLVSALLAAVRGFTREVLAIASWVAAAAAAYALHPMVLPYVKEYISNPQIALAASVAAVFLGTLVIVSFVTVRISDLILDSKIGALDRTLGFIFGAARGLLIAVIAFVFFDKLVGEKQQPDWVRTAKLRPVLKEAGDQILAYMPDNLEGMVQNWQKQRKMQGDPSEPPAAPAVPGSPATPAPAPAPGSAPSQTLPPGQKRTDAAPAPTYGRGQQQTLQQLVETTTAGSTPPKR
jgi:membrane protein required for colicin V production